MRTVSSSHASDDDDCSPPAPGILLAVASSSTTAVAATIDDDDEERPVNVEDDPGEDSDYSYEDDDEGYVSSFLQASATTINSIAETQGNGTMNNSGNGPATIEDEPPVATATIDTSSKWREPTREAVSMSLRAEKETKGGKRRLAQDLYRIMNQDTQKAGFSIEPASEDSMDQWTIKLFQFDQDSNLAKDMLVLGIPSIELNMSFPDNYPFEPPFVRVTRPRFKKQTGFVMSGALCMELLTKDGWNPINDIESVIVSIRSLLVVGDGRLEAASRLSDELYAKRLAKAQASQQLDGGEKTNPTELMGASEGSIDAGLTKRQRVNSAGDVPDVKKDHEVFTISQNGAGSYSASEAEQAYSHLSDYHKKKGWDTSGWWSKRG